MAVINQDKDRRQHLLRISSADGHGILDFLLALLEHVKPNLAVLRERWGVGRGTVKM